MADNRKISQTPPNGIPIWNRLSQELLKDLLGIQFFQNFKAQQAFKSSYEYKRRGNTEFQRIQQKNDEDLYINKRDKTELIIPQRIQIPNLNKEFWNKTQIKNGQLNEKLISIKQPDESDYLYRENKFRTKREAGAGRSLLGKEKNWFKNNRPEQKELGQENIEYKQYRKQNNFRVASKVKGRHGEITKAIQDEFNNTLILNVFAL